MRTKPSSKLNRKRTRAVSTRGAVSVMAMIMLVLFGSLVTAMAIASQGNLRTSATHLYVMKSIGAADTGLVIATERLKQASSRFVMSNSTITPTFASDFWVGNLGAYGVMQVLPPPTGHVEAAAPTGLAEALFNMHAADVNVVNGLGMPVLELRNAPANADPTRYQLTDWLVTPPVAISGPAGTSTDAYQITYAPMANGLDVRVIVTGYDFSYESTTLAKDYDGNLTGADGQVRNQRYITRVVTQDFRLGKGVDNAIISPNRVMIGKNCHVSGNIGVRFSDTGQVNGDPAVLASDFDGLDPALDDEIVTFFDLLAQYDVDNDNRLRIAHPIESVGVPLTPCYSEVGQPPCSGVETDSVQRERTDVTGDGYWDVFDIVIRMYDTPTSGPGANEYDNRIEIATEFVTNLGTPVDPDLALLIDSSKSDRNANDTYGFIDLNGNGIFEELSGETLIDFAFDSAGVIYYPDRELGYLDGYLDYLDQYSKLNGSLSFSIAEGSWAGYETKLEGSIVPDEGDGAINFNADNTLIPFIDSASFNLAATTLAGGANGIAFWQTVADELGVGIPDLVAYTESKPDVGYNPMDPIKPAARYFRIDPDLDFDGMPDNYTDSYVRFERMPFNSPNFSDWYYRPVFENMVFKDVAIPQGLNALFINCTFVGVTYIQSYTANVHPFWNEYGRMQLVSGDTLPTRTHRRELWGDDPTEDILDIYQPILDSMNPAGQFLFRATQVSLDKGDMLTSELNPVNQADFDALPEPIIINGRRVTNTREYSNNLRFHDCLIVGSVVSDPVQEYTHNRNKVQFTGVTRFVSQHPDSPNDLDLNPDPNDLDAISRSTLMLPNYSVDIGHFNSPSSQNVQLKGAIIAGVLDIRGNANINGALLLTFAPILGQGPLQDFLGQAVGNPANFNTTLGYFGPADGDEESIDPNTLPLNGNGDRIAGYDTDGDGIADISPFEIAPPGSAEVLFQGYGKINIQFDNNMVLPDGIMIPMKMNVLTSTYQEGSY